MIRIDHILVIGYSCICGRQIPHLFTWVLNIARSLAKDDIFAACNIAGDDNSNCIFDKVVGQGLSLQAASKLLDLSQPICAHNLRTKINNLRNNNT